MKNSKFKIKNAATRPAGAFGILHFAFCIFNSTGKGLAHA
jgi:hypothetical protein